MCPFGYLLHLPNRATGKRNSIVQNEKKAFKQKNFATSHPAWSNIRENSPNTWVETKPNEKYLIMLKLSTKLASHWRACLFVDAIIIKFTTFALTHTSVRDKPFTALPRTTQYWISPASIRILKWTYSWRPFLYIISGSVKIGAGIFYKKIIMEIAQFISVYLNDNVS